MTNDTQEQEIWKILQEVMDPEIPKLSIVDLGMVTSVSVENPQKLKVVITPTFAGCPAIDYLKHEIYETLKNKGYFALVEVSFEHPWDSNKISARGREILQTMGFAPPPKHDGYISLEVLSNVLCPFCNSSNTILQSPFGPTLCRSIHFCNNCLQSFEQFKPVV